MTSDEKDSLEEMTKRLRTLCSKNSLSPQELERRLQGSRRLREQRISLPFYQEAEKGWKNPEDFWLMLYNSCVNA